MTADITQLLQAHGGGRSDALERLVPIVYDDLRRVARGQLRRLRPGDSLNTTGLVHEAYVRLVGNKDVRWDSRGHFFAAAAEAMRRILVEAARRKKRLKRGGDLERQPLVEDEIAMPEAAEDLEELDAALDRLASKDPRKAELVKLRYFAGLTQEQAAEALGIGISTADRDWSYARAWLFREMSKEGGARG